MEWTGHLSIVTAIFESAKDATTKSIRTRLLLYNQLGPGMSDRSVQLPRSLHLMCPVGVETSCQAFPAVAEDITVDDSVEVAAPAEAAAEAGSPVRGVALHLGVRGFHHVIACILYFFPTLKALLWLCSQIVFFPYLKIEGISL